MHAKHQSPQQIVGEKSGLMLDSCGDWLQDVRRVTSPNHDARPSNTDIDLLVVHGISLPPGEFGGPHIDALFSNRLDRQAHPYFEAVCDLRVSAHALIGRDGAVTQYVAFSRRAWHAGASCFDGRPACNDYSIGIELEGADDVAYEDAQYTRLAEVAQVLMGRFQAITTDRIVGHCDVAPGRKSDPGPAFDWSRLFAELNRDVR